MSARSPPCRDPIAQSRCRDRRGRTERGNHRLWLPDLCRGGPAACDDPAVSRRRRSTNLNPGVGEDVQIESPFTNGAGSPLIECGSNMASRLRTGHSGHRNQMLQSLLFIALDLRESEVRHLVAGSAETDEPGQTLHFGRPVVGPSLVHFEPPLRRSVFRETADLALHPGAPRDHAAQSFPILRFDAVADIGEPTRIRDEVDEQTMTERPVFTRQDLRNVRERDPSRQTCHLNSGRIPSLG